MSITTLAVDVRALKAYSRWWANENDKPDPLAKLDHPKQPQAKAGAIASNADVAKALDAINPYNNDSETAARDRAIMSVFAFTGIRRGELVKLRLDDVGL